MFSLGFLNLTVQKPYKEYLYMLSLRQITKLSRLNTLTKCKLLWRYNLKKDANDVELIQLLKLRGPWRSFKQMNRSRRKLRRRRKKLKKRKEISSQRFSRVQSILKMRYQKKITKRKKNNKMTFLLSF